MDQLPVTFSKLAAATDGEGGLLYLLSAWALMCLGMLAVLSLAARSKGSTLSRWSSCVLIAAVAGVVTLAIEDRVLAVPEGWVAMSAWWLIGTMGIAPAMAIAGLMESDKPRGWKASGWCLLLAGVVLVWPFIELPSLEPRAHQPVASRAEAEAKVAHAEDKHVQQAAPARPAPRRRSQVVKATWDDKETPEPEVARYPTTVPSRAVVTAEAISTSDADYVFPDLNFTYNLPSGGWRGLEVRPGESDLPGLSLMLRRDSPPTEAAIFALPVGVRFSESDLIHEIIRLVQRAYPKSEVSPVVAETVAGIEGASVDVDAQDERGQVYVRYWAGWHGGILYQLVCEYRGQLRSGLANDFSQIAAGFQLINPNVSDPNLVDAEQTVDEYGYRLVLPGDGWIRLSGIDSSPELDQMATRPRTEDTIAVITLPAQCADLEVFSDVVQLILGLSDDQSHRIDVSESDVPHAQGVIDYEGYRWIGSVRVPYRLRLVAGPHTTHAIMAVAAGSNSSALDDLVLCFQLTGEPPSAEPPSYPAKRRAIAEITNEIGLREYDEGHKRAALEKFRIALRYEPQQEAVADNYITTLAEVEGPQAALQVLSDDPPPAFDAVEVALQRGYLLSQMGRFDEAIDAFAAAAAEGPLEEESLLAMGKAATNADRYAEVLTAMDEAIRQRGGPDLEFLRAVMLCRAGRHDESIAVLESHTQTFPNDPTIVYALADAYSEADRLDEAIRVCQAALERIPGDAGLLGMLGRLRFLDGDHEAARAALEACLAKDPADAGAAELLTHLAALDGRGSNRQIREPIEPAPLHPIAAESLHSAAQQETPASAEAAGVFDVHRATSYVCRQGESLRITERMQFRVLNRVGVESMTLFSMNYNPLSERLFVNELVVRDENGAEIGRGSLDDYYVMDDSSDGLDSYKQVVKLPVPGVRPGCTIDLTLTREKLSRSAKIGYQAEFLASSRACGVHLVSLEGDIDRLRFQSKGVKPIRPDDHTIVWSLPNTPPVVDEPYQPDPEEYLPVVWLSDAGESWQTLIDDYLSDLSETLKPDAEVEQLASTLVSPTDSPARRIEILSRHVQDAITYQGLEFGVRGIIPHPVARVCRVGTGDCKDHSLLLHHLLREVGIPSYLAVVNTSGPVQPDLPSLDQFDHMVVVVPNMPLRDGSTAKIGLIDATQKTIDPLKGVPASLAGKRILVLDENRTGLDELPAASIDDGLIACKRTATIEFDSPELGTASLRVSESVEFGSSLSSLLRLAMQGDTAMGQRDTLQRMIADRRAVEVQEAYAENLDDPTKPLVVHCEYVVSDAFQEVGVQGKPLTGTLPGHWADLYCSPTKVADRITPFEFSIPVTFRSETRLVAPPGYHVASQSAASLGKSSGPFAWRWQSTEEPGGNARFVLELRRSAGTFAAGEYAGYQRAAELALRATGRAITVTRTEMASQSGPSSTTRQQ